MKIDITELRRQRRPLWMSELDLESTADILGGGGDLFSDRIPAEWARYSGEEVPEDLLASEILAGVEEDYIS